MPADQLTSEEWKQLIELLESRLSVIADTDFRDRDADAHLAELQRVSEEITALHQSVASRCSARLGHFLTNCSFDKALAWARENAS